ncbi:MAG: LacI family DNA-binding transcriptional regulator [Eubacteriales bacterium]|nr:LacI family DNA-binding transcriptional regulator [Eubacteriales bacterium]
MANITIKDIARLANVTPAAVSYVINNRPGVSEEKRNTILKIIKETGYNPSLSSRKLVLNKSFNIHIVVSSEYTSFDNLFYNTAIKRMMEICMKNGYNLVLSNTEDFENSRLLHSISQRDVDGVIFLLSATPAAVQCLKENDIPYVVLDAHMTDNGSSTVFCDYSEASYASFRYLVSMGHRKIGFVGMKAIPEFFAASLNGYRKALEDSRIALDEEWIYGVDNEDDFGDFSSILSHKGITAVLCATDIIAVNFMKELTKHNIKVPDDVSVCGLDDIVIAKYATPALTTVEIDKCKMGEEAVSLLIKMIDGDVETENICVHCTKVIERESVKKI